MAKIRLGRKKCSDIFVLDAVTIFVINVDSRASWHFPVNLLNRNANLLNQLNLSVFSKLLNHKYFLLNMSNHRANFVESQWFFVEVVESQGKVC